MDKLQLKEKVLDVLESVLNINILSLKTENIYDLIRMSDAFEKGYTINTWQHYIPQNYNPISDFDVTHVEIILKIEEEFNIEFTDTEAENITTINNLIDAIEQKTNTAKP